MPRRERPKAAAPTAPGALWRGVWFRRGFGAVAWLGLALLAAAMTALDPLPMQTLRHAQFDQFQRWQPREPLPAPVRVIDIDDRSLAELGQWPWPRTRLAELVDVLHAHGAAVVAFDVVFAEADRTSPRAAARLWAANASAQPMLAGDAARQQRLQQDLAALPDHDERFAQSLAHRPVVLGMSLGPDTQTAAANPAYGGPNRFVVLALGAPMPQAEVATALVDFPGAVWPLGVLQQQATAVGALSFVADGDGIVRRVPWVLSYRGELVPTLAAEALRVAQGAAHHTVIWQPEAGDVLGVRTGAVEMPTNAQGEVWLHYAQPQPGRFVSAVDVLQGRLPNESLRDHIVLVGTSAQGLLDLRFNPLGQTMAGVDAHAQAIEQALHGQWLVRPGWAHAAEVLGVAVSVMLLGLLATRVRAAVSLGLALGWLAVSLGGAWWAFAHARFLVDGLWPFLAGTLALVVGSVAHHLASERDQRWIKTAFARYVSPNLVEHLVSHQDGLALGGQRRVCSFVFTDLAGFTSLMEKLDPAEAVGLLNVYLDRMIAIAFEHQGTLDRIVGDAVAILFSAPVPQADHQARALRCALAMEAFASQYAAEVQGRGVPFGITRIGVHSGEVIVGNFGGGAIFDYRALGDAVNTAARLEGANKHLGTRVCVSQAVLDGVADAPSMRPVGRLQLKGKSLPLMVWEPVLSHDTAQRAPLADYARAFDMLGQSDRDGAVDAFTALAQAWPDDPLVRLHARHLTGPLTHPALDVLVLQEK